MFYGCSREAAPFLHLGCCECCEPSCGVNHMPEVEEVQSVEAEAGARGSLPEETVGGYEDAVSGLESLVSDDDEALEAGEVDQDPEAEEEEESEEPEESDEENEESDEEEESDGDETEDDSEVQRVPYERLKKEVAKRKAAEESADALKKRVEQLEKTAADALGLSPDYVTADEVELLKAADWLEQRQEFLFVNMDGYEDENDPSKSMSAAEVRKELLKIQREATRKVGAAQALYDERKAQMLADMKAGRALRLEAEKKPVKPASKVGSPKAKKRPIAIEPVSSVPKPKRKVSGLDVESFEKAGGGFDAAVNALESLV